MRGARPVREEMQELPENQDRQVDPPPSVTTCCKFNTNNSPLDAGPANAANRKACPPSSTTFW